MMRMKSVAKDYDQAAEYDPLRDKGTIGDPGHGTEEETPYVWTEKKSFSRKEFLPWSGLDPATLSKFEQDLGFVTPIVAYNNGWREVYYSVHELKKVRVMMALLDGKINLNQAHRKAKAILRNGTGHEDDAVKKALGLMRVIEDPPKDPVYDQLVTEMNPDGAPTPSEVTLRWTHADGTEGSMPLSGKLVPNALDWDVRADHEWLKHHESPNGWVVRIWMEDASGQRYLRELSYQP